jgi:hypothetical protein
MKVNGLKRETAETDKDKEKERKRLIKWIFLLNYGFTFLGESARIQN